VNFEKCPEDKCARVVALRDIEVGEEIFADYGKWYWASLKPARMSTAVLKALIEKHCCNNRVDEGKQPEQTV
jgi:SET domain-containing protein